MACLASVLDPVTEQAEAEDLLREALSSDERSLGEDHATVALRKNNLANLLMDTDRAQEAELLLRNALETWERVFGSDHPRVATALGNLAVLLDRTKRRKEAEDLQESALRIDEAALGTDHPSVSVRLNNLALLYSDRGRMFRSISHMRRAVAILDEFEERTGHAHPNASMFRRNLRQLVWARRIVLALSVPFFVFCLWLGRWFRVRYLGG